MLSAVGANRVLDGLIVSTISLHSSFPGQNGTAELSGGSYARKNISIPQAANQSRDWAGQIVFDVPGNSTVAWYGLWSATAFLAAIPNGGVEQEVRRVLGTGTFDVPQHGFVSGDTVVLLGSVPAQFAEGTPYYVVNPNADFFQLSATMGGSVITTTNAVIESLQVSKINIEQYGQPGTFTVTALALKARWSESVITGFRWLESRPTEVVLSDASPTYNLAQHVSQAPTKVYVSPADKTALEDMGVALDEVSGVLSLTGPAVAGSLVATFNATDVETVNQSSDAYYYKEWTDDELRVPEGSYGGMASEFWLGEPFQVRWRENIVGDYYKDTIQGGVTTPVAGGAWAQASAVNTVGAATSFDITTLVKAIADGNVRNHGFLIRTSSSGTLRFSSSQVADATVRPVVEVVTNSGTQVFQCTGDSSIDSSTGSSGSMNQTLTTSSVIQSALSFNLSSLTSGAAVLSATLKIFRATQVSGVAPQTIQVFRLKVPDQKKGGTWYPFRPMIDPETGGLAASNAEFTGIDGQKYTVGLYDQNLEKHPDVVFFDKFDKLIIKAKSTGGWEAYNHNGFPGDSTKWTKSWSKWLVYDDKRSFTGDLVTGNDVTYNMTSLYPNMPSVRSHWPGFLNDPSHPTKFESNSIAITTIEPGGWFRVASPMPVGPPWDFVSFGINPGWNSTTTSTVCGFTGTVPPGMEALQMGQIPSNTGGYTTELTGKVYYAVPDVNDLTRFQIAESRNGAPLTNLQSTSTDIRIRARKDNQSPAPYSIDPIPRRDSPGLGWPELYARAYYCLSDDFFAIQQGNKQPVGGVDCRYDHMANWGMGYGNGGVAADGFSGFALRGHSEIQSHSPIFQGYESLATYFYIDSGMSHLSIAASALSGSTSIQLDSYVHEKRKGASVEIDLDNGQVFTTTCSNTSSGNLRIADPLPSNASVGNKVRMLHNSGGGYYDIFRNQAGETPTGSNANWNAHGLGWVQRGRWYCVDWYFKINTVRPNPQYNPAHAAAGVKIGIGDYPGTFTSPLGLPASGFWDANNTMPCMKPKTLPDGRTVQALAAPGSTGNTFFGSSGAAWGAQAGLNYPAFRQAVIERTPTRCNYDGEYKVWVNGRLAMHRQNLGGRHVEVIKDGVTPWLIYFPWFEGQIGGKDRDHYIKHSWLGHVVISKKYIGPMKLPT